MLAGTGIGLGLVLTVAVVRLLRNEVFGLSAPHGMMLVLAPALLVAAAALAAWLPARRALRVDPLDALRSQ